MLAGDRAHDARVGGQFAVRQGRDHAAGRGHRDPEKGLADLQRRARPGVLGEAGSAGEVDHQVRPEAARVEVPRGVGLAEAGAGSPW